MERLRLCAAKCSVVGVILRSDNRGKKENEKEEAVGFSKREISF
jgi:hypothetical protein